MRRDRDRPAPRRSPRSCAAAFPARCPWPGSRWPRWRSRAGAPRRAPRASRATAPRTRPRRPTRTPRRDRRSRAASRAAGCRAGSRRSRGRCRSRPPARAGGPTTPSVRCRRRSCAPSGFPTSPAPMTPTSTRSPAATAWLRAERRCRRSRAPRVFALLEAGGIDLTRACDALDDGGHHPLGRLLHVVMRVGTIGSPTTAVCPIPHCQRRLAPLRQDPVRPPEPDRRASRPPPVAVPAAVPVSRPCGSRSSEIVPSGNTHHALAASESSLRGPAMRLGAAARADHGQNSGAAPDPAETWNDCRQVFRVAKALKPSGGARRCRRNSSASWVKNSRASFSELSSSALGDSFSTTTSSGVMKAACVDSVCAASETVIPDRVDRYMSYRESHWARI